MLTRTLELFCFPGCPFVQRTQMTLLEKVLPFTLTEIDVGNKSPAFLAISPQGKVPVLRHGEATVFESGIINQYLDEVFPEPPLLPEDPFLRSQARFWMDFCDTRFLQATRHLMSTLDDPEKLAESRDKVTEVLRLLEHEGLRKLGSGPYFFGSRVSLTDLHFSPFFERFGVYETLGGAVWPPDCTRLRTWFAALQKRDSYQATAHSLEEHLAIQRKVRA